MLRALQYAPYAVKHHWTPDQVDDLPADVAPYLLAVEHELEEMVARVADI